MLTVLMARPYTAVGPECGEAAVPQFASMPSDPLGLRWPGPRSAASSLSPHIYIPPRCARSRVQTVHQASDAQEMLMAE
jgi:hypothetical protein